jgi:hypothetical protein
MEALLGAALGALVAWLVVYTAVRGAIGDMRPAPPPFCLTWASLGERGELTLENVGRAPACDVVVRRPGTSRDADAPLMEALLLHPGERLRVAVDRATLGEGDRADAHECVVHLDVRHRRTLVPQGAEIRTSVPVRIPVAGATLRAYS